MLFILAESLRVRRNEIFHSKESQGLKRAECPCPHPSYSRVAGKNQESPGLVEVGTRWMKRVKETTKLPEGMLSVELFVPDMFGNDVLVTR